MNVPPITIPNFRPKRSKSIPVFRPKRLKNHALWGGTYLYTLYRGVPPSPGGYVLVHLHLLLLALEALCCFVSPITNNLERCRLLPAPHLTNHRLLSWTAFPGSIFRACVFFLPLPIPRPFSFSSTPTQASSEFEFQDALAVKIRLAFSCITSIFFSRGRCGDLMACALDYGSSPPGYTTCSWVRHLTLTVPLSTQVYKWVSYPGGVEIFLDALCYRNPDKLRPNGLPRIVCKLTNFHECL